MRIIPFNNRYVQVLIISIVLFSLAVGLSASVPGTEVTKLWEREIGGSKHWVSVANTGRVAVVKDTTNSSELIILSPGGKVTQRWTPPSRDTFDICLAREGCIVATYGDTVSLFSPDGANQQWGVNLDSLYGVGIADNCERIYVTNAPFDKPSTVVAVDGKGNTLWARQLNSRVWDPAVSKQGYIALGGQDYGPKFEKGENAVHLLNPSGNLLWSKKTDSPVIDVAINEDATRIAAGLDAGEMLFLNRKGQVLWEKSEIGGWLGMSTTGETIVTGKDGHIVAFNSEGILEWGNAEVPTGLGAQAIKVVKGGKLTAVKVTWMGNKVFLLDEEGKKLYQRSLSGYAPDMSISESGKYVALAGQSVVLFQVK